MLRSRYCPSREAETMHLQGNNNWHCDQCGQVQDTMPIVIPQTLKDKLLELRTRNVAVFVPERIDRLLNLEGTENYTS